MNHDLHFFVNALLLYLAHTNLWMTRCEDITKNTELKKGKLTRKNHQTSTDNVDVAGRPLSFESLFQDVFLKTGVSSSSLVHSSDNTLLSRHFTLDCFIGKPIQRDCNELHNPSM